MGETPFEFAEKWYTAEATHRYMRTSEDVPTDVRSFEFAEWMTTNMRLAMAKGINIGMEMERTKLMNLEDSQ